MAIKYFKVHFFARSYDRTTQKDNCLHDLVCSLPEPVHHSNVYHSRKIDTGPLFFLGWFFLQFNFETGFLCQKETDITHNMCCASFIQWSPSVFSVMQRLIKKWRALLEGWQRKLPVSADQKPQWMDLRTVYNGRLGLGYQNQNLMCQSVIAFSSIFH